MEESIWMWVGFLALVGFLLILDLGLFNRGNKHITLKKALALSAFWIGIGLAFGVFVHFFVDGASSTEYYAAYIVEKMMSVDNIFVFIVIFAYFKIPEDSQHKALFYGIIGAIVFRALFIFAGAEIIHQFSWTMYIFGALLIYLAVKTVFKKEASDEEVAENFLVRFFRKFMHVTDECDGDKVFTVKDGVKVATPLFLAIIALESTDILFAIDSIPAVLAISKDTFIVYTSNIFAILGLRSLYFALRGGINSLNYLKYGLGAILAFVGMKMFAEAAEFHHPIFNDVIYSLVIILGILAITVVVSLYANKRNGPSPTEHSEHIPEEVPGEAPQSGSCNEQEDQTDDGKIEDPEFEDDSEH